MKTSRLSLLIVCSAVATATPGLTAVTNRDQFTMHAGTFAFERGSMNPIVKDAANNWYLVVQLSGFGQAEVPGTACTDPNSQVDTNLPCWLKWNTTTKNWEEHAQPKFPTPTFPTETGTCTSCQWYVDTDSRGEWVIAAYVDKSADDIFLFSFSKNPNGTINFSDKQVAKILTPAEEAESQPEQQFAAVALDDTGCAYALSVVDIGDPNATPPIPSGTYRPKMHHIDLIKAGGRTSVESRHNLDRVGTVDNFVSGNEFADGGDVVLTTDTSGNGRVVAMWSDQLQTETYFYKREHTVHTSDACGNGWLAHGIVNQTAFERIPPSERVDGHIAMAPWPPLWFAVMKTSGANDSDNPIMVLVREGDEDVYEVVDRLEPVFMPFGGMSRPSLWMNPGDQVGAFVAYQDRSNDPRNTVITRFNAIPEADANCYPTCTPGCNPACDLSCNATCDHNVIEWENGKLGKNLWPRMVFSACEDETVHPPTSPCLANRQENGEWKGAAWSSVRLGGTSNFLMTVKDSETGDNEVITAEITWPDWGCTDQYDNDGDGDGNGGVDNHDKNDDGCGTTPGANAPEDTACSDTIDNDGDGKIDWNGGPGGELKDLQCDNGDSDPSNDVRDNTEAVCGLGFEAGVALLAIAGVRARFRSASTRKNWKKAEK